MNVRCAFCQTPYTLSRVAMLDALQEVDSKQLSHYDAHCPRCRRATQIPRQRLEMAMPNWRDALKEFEVDMKEHPQHAAPEPAHESTPAAEAGSKPEPKSGRERRPAPKPKSPPKTEPVSATAKGRKTTKKSK